ncbi:MAG: DUF1259 domain-containing protein [Thermodesulfobacteriota bacterium]
MIQSKLRIILKNVTILFLGCMLANLFYECFPFTCKSNAQTVSPAVPEEASSTDYSNVEKILNTTGQMKEGVFVVQFPRSDLKMKINDEPMPVALGFTSWVAFKKITKGFIIMGDLVLLEKEINPVISSPTKAGIKITALHNHFLGEEPRLMYMHIYGEGNADQLSRGIREALHRTATPSQHTVQDAPNISIYTNKLEEIIGHKGQKVGGGVFKITVGRSGVKHNDIELTSSMGINSWAAFTGTNERSHVAGDIVMTAEEVNPVIGILRQGGIEIFAVHNHMLDEKPRIFFLHYWGTGPAEKLAQTVRKAFDEVKKPIE